MSTAVRATDSIEIPAQAGQPPVYVSTYKVASAKAPVAIMLHGAEGLTPAVIAALETWAAWLKERGVASVIVDSYRGRHIGGVHDFTSKAQFIAVTRDREVDIERTLAWLGSSDWADPSRAFLFGQSAGATTAIAFAIEKKRPLPQVLTYPFCLVGEANLSITTGYPPSLWLIPANDTTARPAETKKCMDKISSAGNANVIEWVVLPNSDHMFDRRPDSRAYSRSAINAARTEIDSFLRSQGLAH